MPGSSDDPSQAIEGEVLTVNPDAIELGRANRGGRPTDMTPDTVAKLIAAFNNGFNITEACLYAEIDRSTYYRWLEKDDRFSYKMSEAQAAVNRRAKVVVTEAINSGDINAAKWWLNARDPEFSAKGQIAPPPGQQKTEEKLKEFMDDTNDGAYADTAGENAERPELAASSGSTSDDEVATSPTDFS